MESNVTVGRGNVFADLGFENSTELQAKATLSIYIEEAIKQRRWSQTQAAERTGLPEHGIEHVLRGDLDSFSLSRLIDCLNRLDRDVEIRVSPPKGRKGHLTVVARTT